MIKRLINFSDASLIALHSLAVIVQSKSGQLNVREIAEQINASENHVSKVMQRLTKTGIAGSVRGPAGGFMILKKPEAITLLDIFEAIEGRAEANDCPFGKSKCVLGSCLFEGLVCELNDKFHKYMNEKNLSDFISE